MNDLQRYMFDVQGFLVLRNVLSRAEIDELVEAVEAVRDAGGDSVVDMPDKSTRFVDFLDRGQPFRDLLDHPAVTGTLNELLAPGFRIDHYYGMRHVRGTGLLPLHGGGHRRGSDFYDFKNGTMYNGFTVVSWALTTRRPYAPRSRRSYRTSSNGCLPPCTNIPLAGRWRPRACHELTPRLSVVPRVERPPGRESDASSPAGVRCFHE